MDLIMTIYKIVDIQKHTFYAFVHLDISHQEIDVLKGGRDDHYCFLEVVEIGQG